MSKIIDFPRSNPKAEAEKGLSYKPKENYCRCLTIEVSEYDRTVECRNCGATLDPFEWCVTVCKEWQHLEQRKKHIERQGLDAAKKLKDIKRQITNAKSQLKRALTAKVEIPKPEMSAKSAESLNQLIMDLGDSKS